MKRTLSFSLLCFALLLSSFVFRPGSEGYQVGDKAADVEMHLKGSHSTTNADRVKEVEAATTGLDGSKSVP